MRRMLERYYGTKYIFPNDMLLDVSFSAEYPDEKWLISNKNKLPKYKALFLHWPLYFKNELPRKHRTALFVRDPLQRTLSVLADGSIRFKRPVEDLLKDQNYINNYIKNIQTRFLGSRNENEFRYGGELELLKNTLPQIEDINFLGITELFNDSCLMFDKTFGTKISLLQMKENVLRPCKSDLMEYAERVKPWIEKDQILYENIKVLFAKRKRNIGL